MEPANWRWQCGCDRLQVYVSMYTKIVLKAAYSPVSPPIMPCDIDLLHEVAHTLIRTNDKGHTQHCMSARLQIANKVMPFANTLAELALRKFKTERPYQVLVSCLCFYTLSLS